MKKFVSIILFISFVVTFQAGAKKQDLLQCHQQAELVARKFLAVVDLRSSKGFSGALPSDSIKIIKYEVTTPGSFDQRYQVQAIIDSSISEKSHLLQFEMTGDYDCDGLKVKKFKELSLSNKNRPSTGLGGVERVD